MNFIYYFCKEISFESILHIHVDIFLIWQWLVHFNKYWDSHKYFCTFDKNWQAHFSLAFLSIVYNIFCKPHVNQNEHDLILQTSFPLWLTIFAPQANQNDVISVKGINSSYLKPPINKQTGLKYPFSYKRSTCISCQLTSKNDKHFFLPDIRRASITLRGTGGYPIQLKTLRTCRILPLVVRPT